MTKNSSCSPHTGYNILQLQRQMQMASSIQQNNSVLWGDSLYTQLHHFLLVFPPLLSSTG